MNLLKKITSPHHLRQQLGGVLFLFLILFARPGTRHLECQMVIPLGITACALGFCGRIWASGYLVKNDALTTTGPYGYVRNPIYVFNLLLGLGLVLISGLYWAVVLLAALYWVCYSPGMRIEEENLRRRYGSAFDAYALAVPLIAPRLSPVSGYGGDVWRMSAYLKNKEIFVTAGILIGIVFSLWKRYA